MARTYAEELALYEAAEAKILVGQSYKMPDGRELVRADLDAVVKRLKELRVLAAREADTGGGMRVRLGVPSRR